MEDWIYFLLAGAVALILVLVKFVSSTGKKTEELPPPANVPQRQNARGQPNRRVAAVRNRRAPGRRVADDTDSDDADGDQGQGDTHAEASQAEEALLNDPKLGVKKRAKLEAKIEKRAQRETEERLREEKKKRDAKDEEENKKKELEEQQLEKQRIADEIRMKEEAAQRELEEYLKMKETFSIEEEGCDVNNEEEEENLLEKFVNHIKAQKVILFEELATKFGLRVPEAINRLNCLVESGRITGVMDDRGKFIYVSEEELAKFAKFIKQRGRVTVAELVENSNQIINITPEIIASES